MQTIAVGLVDGPVVARTSSASGALRFASPSCARHAAIDARACGVRIARLPDDARQRRGAMHGVLAGAARDLQHDAACRQHAREHGEDGIAIARGGGRAAARGGLLSVGAVVGDRS